MSTNLLISDMTNPIDLSAAAQGILDAKEPGASRFKSGRYYILITGNGLKGSQKKTDPTIWFRLEGTTVSVLETAEKHTIGNRPAPSLKVGEECSAVWKQFPDPDGYGQSDILNVLMTVTGLDKAGLAPHLAGFMDYSKGALSPAVVEVLGHQIEDKNDATKPYMTGKKNPSPFVKVRVQRVLPKDEVAAIPGIEKFLTKEQISKL